MIDQRRSDLEWCETRMMSDKQLDMVAFYILKKYLKYKFTRKILYNYFWLLAYIPLGYWDMYFWLPACVF